MWVPATSQAFQREQIQHACFNAGRFWLLRSRARRKVSGHGYENGFDLLLMLDVRWPYYIGTEHLLVTSRWVDSYPALTQLV